mmetsp:Transcript_42/g.62  ORF Transcript_42/g.62 Transcript_42/m.62 type:complete len:82 (-) Transcript_42:700-945(-)
MILDDSSWNLFNLTHGLGKQIGLSLSGDDNQENMVMLVDTWDAKQTHLFHLYHNLKAFVVALMLRKAGSWVGIPISRLNWI